MNDIQYTKYLFDSVKKISFAKPGVIRDTYGKGENFIGKIRGGEVGIILDGRGREIIFEEDNGKRINQIIKWSKNSNEYGG